MLKNYKFENNIPTLEEYKYLCESVGWSNHEFSSGGNIIKEFYIVHHCQES